MLGTASDRSQGDEKVEFVALVGGRLVSCVGAPRAVLRDGLERTSLVLVHSSGCDAMRARDLITLLQVSHDRGPFDTRRPPPTTYHTAFSSTLRPPCSTIGMAAEYEVGKSITTCFRV